MRLLVQVLMLRGMITYHQVDCQVRFSELNVTDKRTMLTQYFHQYKVYCLSTELHLPPLYSARHMYIVLAILFRPLRILSTLHQHQT